MRKGEIKKQEILNTAETLFCRKGYEETSVQDILDALHTSKGSFYHHYVSKESLLDAMCEKRAEQIAHSALAESEKKGTPLEKLNCMISSLIPLAGERLSFLMMILPVFSSAQGRSIRNSYCDALQRNFQEPVATAIRDCKEDGTADVFDPESGAVILLTIANQFWCDLCDIMIAQARKDMEMPDVSGMIREYRMAMERILSAPYGSIDLISLKETLMLFAQIRTHWK